MLMDVNIVPTNVVTRKRDCYTPPPEDDHKTINNTRMRMKASGTLMED
jgi:hypothetical protein